MRGRLQVAGPVTAELLAADLGLTRSRALAALTALEAEGTAMRGRYTPPGNRVAQATGGSAAHPSPRLSPQGERGFDGDAIEWCDRRLLARIHRMTLDRLRRQIEPVAPTAYLRFLTEHQHLTPESRWSGPAGVREAIRQLQGFEMAAGAWERRILPARVKDYEPTWLDQLALSGELAWGRLRPFRPEQNGRASASRLTRAVPVSLMLRSDLAWLLPAQRECEPAQLRGNAQAALEALTARGRCFTTTWPWSLDCCRRIWMKRFLSSRSLAC